MSRLVGDDIERHSVADCCRRKTGKSGSRVFKSFRLAPKIRQPSADDHALGTFLFIKNGRRSPPSFCEAKRGPFFGIELRLDA